jgi:hypothetical protein
MLDLERGMEDVVSSRTRMCSSIINLLLDPRPYCARAAFCLCATILVGVPRVAGTNHRADFSYG